MKLFGKSIWLMIMVAIAQLGATGAPMVVWPGSFTNRSEDGSLLALDAQTENKMWSAGSSEAGYSTPLEKLYPSEIVVFNQSDLNS